MMPRGPDFSSFAGAAPECRLHSPTPLSDSLGQTSNPENSDVTIVVESLRSASVEARQTRHPVTRPSMPSNRPRSSDLLKDNDGWIDPKFRLLEKLGEGGFGLVYKAEQVQPIARLVAVKILKAGADSGEVIARFDLERQSLAMMEHPNIAKVLDAGETDLGLPFFVMELVRGRSLTSHVKLKSLDRRARIELFKEVCHAVHHAHQKGIIHRDLKPSNILVCDESGRDVPKVIDFGIAKLLENKELSVTLATGIEQIVGTPGYISPEQIEHGSSKVDTRSDVYALGSILFELLTGRPLITQAELSARPLHHILRDQAENDPPKPSSIEPTLKGDLDWIILKALEREPDRRYGSADDLIDDLEHFLKDEPVSATPPSRGYVLRKFVRRHRLAVSAAAAVLAAVLIGGITSTAMYYRAERNRVAALKASSLSDTRMAAQLQVGPAADFSGSVALLTRALRTDPDNGEAAANLLSLLAHGSLMHSLSPQLPLPQGCREARLVALSPSQQKVVAVSRLSNHEVLSCWPVSGGPRRDEHLPDGVLVTTMQMSPDGSELYFGRDDGVVMRWSLKSGKPPQALQPRLPPARQNQPQSALSLAISGDGRTLAAGGDYGRIQVWDLGQPEQEARVLDHPAPKGVQTPINHLVLDFLGSVAATGSNTSGGDQVRVRGVAAVWDLQSGEIIGDLVQVDEGLSAIAVQAPRQWLAFGLNDGSAHVVHYTQTEEVIGELKHPSAVTRLSFEAGGSMLVVGDGGGFVHAWDMTSGKPALPARAHDGAIVDLGQSQQAGLMVSVSRHGEFQVWDMRSGQVRSQRLRHSLSAVSLSNDASVLVMAPRYQGFVQAWRVHSRMTTRRFEGGRIAGLDQAPPKPARAAIKGNLLAYDAASDLAALAAGADGQLQLWHWSQGRELGRSFKHPPAVGALAFNRKAGLLATAGRDQEVRFWRMPQGPEASVEPTGLVLRFDRFISAIAFDDLGRRLVSVSDDGELRIWDAVSGASLTPPIRIGARVSALSVEPKSQRLLFRVEQQGWYSLPMPALHPAPLPAWFLELAEALCRRRLSSDSKSEDLDISVLEQARQKLAGLKSDEAATGYKSWAQWLLADPRSRPLSPQDSEPLPVYLQRLQQSKDEAAAEEVHWLSSP